MNQLVWESAVTRPFSWAMKPCLLGKKVVSGGSDLGPHVALWCHLISYCLGGAAWHSLATYPVVCGHIGE